MIHAKRFCSICRLGDGPLVPAAFVATAPAGAQWFECAECAELGGMIDEFVTLTPIEQATEIPKC